MLVGITGGIGSGKTTVVKLFSQFENVAVYYADIEAKKLMNTSLEIRKNLIAEFSEEVYNEEGLNRPFLAKIVFENKEKLKILNSIVHPEVHKHLQNFIKENKNRDYILYENAILFENGSHKMCDVIITVTAPKEIRIQRVIERDKVAREAVLHRMNNQWPEVKKTIQSNYIIENLDLTKLAKNVEIIHNKLTE
ncbi:dephospho-CoA kinase [uncultured Tenacibaculum sp.]|uniref:dephospho-CoA kinase n=1 Tax=uncultured Tenacibaculum sp. TaxID=174713 RepID=UPI0026016EDC|nr:dephospho-CoA kinase [uncultured Tenacibaculum sp.]